MNMSKISDLNGSSAIFTDTPLMPRVTTMSSYNVYYVKSSIRVEVHGVGW